MDLMDNPETLVSMQHMIDLDSDNGNVFGYAISTRLPNIGHYLADFTPQSEAIAAHLQAAAPCAALIKNMNVDEDARGQGEGNQLMCEFMDDAGDFGAEVMLLVADTGEDQQEGFNLVTWYEGFDFETVLITNAGPLMVYPPEAADALRRALNPG